MPISFNLTERSEVMMVLPFWKYVEFWRIFFTWRKTFLCQPNTYKIIYKVKIQIPYELMKWKKGIFSYYAWLFHEKMFYGPYLSQFHDFGKIKYIKTSYWIICQQQNLVIFPYGLDLIRLPVEPLIRIGKSA